MCSAILDVVAAYYLSAIIPFFMAVGVYLLIRNDMQNMGQYLLLFIIFALIAVFLSLMTLFACVFGRTTSTTTLVSSLDGTSTWVTDTTITAFFDSAMGWRYNLESVSMICSVVVSLYATILSFVSHTQSSDEGPDAEAGWLVRAPPPQYGVADNVERHQRTPTFNAFSGQGRALPADTDDEK